MPQMHPLLWTLLFSFSLVCLMFTMSVVFFSSAKPIQGKGTPMKPRTKSLNWKW